MWKKVLLSIIIVAVFILALSLFASRKKNKNLQQDNQNIVENEVEELSKYVTDDCIDEWEDYAEYVEEELKETGSLVVDENRMYIIKSKNDIIEIYYLSDNNEEVLYKTTEISTNYLAEQDVKNLEKGIKVQGIENLNKMLEDFE